MLETVFDSQDVLEPDRVEAFRAITANTLVPTEITEHTEQAPEFRALLRAASMGQVEVSSPTHVSLRSRRTRRLIRQSDPEMYAVALILRGQMGMIRQRCEVTLQAGDLVSFSTSHPYEGLVEARQGTSSSVVVQVPRVLVPLSSNRVEQLLFARMPGRDGVGGLLAGFLTHLITDTVPGRPADSQRLGSVLVDLVTAWLAHHLDAEDQTSTEGRQHIQFLEIQDFICRHLGDTGLAPATIAAAHHVSLRSLHRLFRNHAHGVTVAAYIRHQRLTRAQRDLGDPRLVTQPVRAIAARWGFTSPADFTRAFRAAYGITPTEYRQAARAARPGTHW